jgi:hypothetical protein
MIELIDIPSPRAVGAKISGKIEKPDLDQVIAAIEQKLLKVDKIGIYVELESFGGISFDALADDVKFALANIKRFDKKAVVSGEEWVGKTAEFADKIFSGIEIRHFSPEEREKAKKWVAE